MKIRHMAVLYGILILLVMLGVFYFCTNENIVSRDMVHFNEKLQLINEETRNGTERHIIENKLDCTILFLTDIDYKARLNECMKEQAVIFDIVMDEAVIGKAIWNEEERIYQTLRKHLLLKIEVFCLVLLVVGFMILGIIYAYFVRPFHRLQVFSNEVAKGNLELPLPMHKHNFFGAFTESFDIMREELQRAKENEYRANRSKKELMAELSHDIKTPLATIKATCEVIQAKETKPDVLEKVNVIVNKSEMIDSLVGNMFHATLEELEVLKVEVTEESTLSIRQMFDELKFYGEIQFENEIPECLVFMDKLRLTQVIDNIVNNAYKYAVTPVFVSFLEEEAGIRIHIKDEGKGVGEEELALITEKYYRGSNTKGKAGSGLGLFLTKMFMERMNGGMECYNITEECRRTGFMTVLFLKKV